MGVRTLVYPPILIKTRLQVQQVMICDVCSLFTEAESFDRFLCRVFFFPPAGPLAIQGNL